MSYEHPSTAISPDSQFVKDLLRLIAGSDPLIEGFPLVSYLLPTGEASYWNYLRSTITCTIFVFFAVRLVRRSFWVLCLSGLQLSLLYRVRGRSFSTQYPSSSLLTPALLLCVQLLPVPSLRHSQCLLCYRQHS